MGYGMDTYIDQIAQIFHKVLVDGRVGCLQAQLVLVLRLEGLQSCIGVLVLAFENFLLDELVLFAAFQFLLGNALLQLHALVFGGAELLFRFLGLGLVRVVGFHVGVQLLQDAQYFDVCFEANFAALMVRKGMG